MKTVRTFTELTQAIVAQNSLAAAGVESAIPDQNTPAPMAGNLGRVELLVAETDFAEADRILGHEESAPRSAPARPATRLATDGADLLWLRRLAFVDLTLSVGFYAWGSLVPVSHPSYVQAYLEAFAFGNQAWDIGYNLSNAGLLIQVIGLFFFIVQSRRGRWIYACGIALQVAVIATLPPAVGPSVVGGFYWLSNLTQGALLVLAFRDRTRS